jgi:hypothetical protein
MSVLQRSLLDTAESCDVWIALTMKRPQGGAPAASQGRLLRAEPDVVTTIR